MNLSELDQHCRAGQAAPIYLCLGPEAFLRRSAIARIVTALSGDSPMTPTRMPAEETSLAAALDAARTLDLFAPHRCLVVGDVGAWKAGSAEMLAAYAAAPNPQATLVCWAEKLDQRVAIAKALLAHAAVVECKALYANQVPEWVRIECRRAGREISREAARLLAEAAGAELGIVQQAITKVVLFTEGKRLIELADVEAVVLETSQRSIFELLHAVGKKDRLAMMRLLHRLLDAGEPPVRLCTMLAWHWRLLLRAKEALASGERDLARALKVSPFFAKDYAAQAGGFSMDRLRAGFAHLATADRTLKRSRLRPLAVLTNTLMQLVD
ncbi:MAG: DNA polymerase III subunit delta [Deltaproteobacteria bacterium]|nr:DNA polymerase III subunit delta [Deltaproteobacteria bacterium]